MTLGEFLKTKNTYYSGVAGAMGGLIGGQAWHSALISATIATIDVACFPQERPAHIGAGKWFLGNLLSSTASGVIAWAIGHGTRSVFKGDDKRQNFVEHENQRRLTPSGDPEKTR
jgi:hypothetical protein